MVNLCLNLGSGLSEAVQGSSDSGSSRSTTKYK